MAGSFHLYMEADSFDHDEYFVRSVAASIARDQRLLSLRVHRQGKLALGFGSASEYSPLDHVVEATFDLAPLARMSRDALCLLSDRPLAMEMGADDAHWRAARAAALDGRLATFDQGTWGRMRISLGLIPLLLPSPALHGERQLAPAKHVAILVNDEALSSRMLGDVVDIVKHTVADAQIQVKDNRWNGPATGQDWLSPGLRGALCHIHLGTPFELRPYGRLIDSAACQVPIIHFRGGIRAVDNPCPGLEMPAPPHFIDEVHLLETTSTVRFGAGLRDLVHDVALRSQLIGNASSLCRKHNASCAASVLDLIEGKTAEGLR